MMPKKGGDPLPVAPVCLGARHGLCHKQAAAYVKALQEALEDEKRGWSAQQRQYIRQLINQWKIRAQGEDAHFEKHGTFPRPVGSEPPGHMDVVVENIRRKLKAEGKYVSNRAHFEKTHMQNRSGFIRKKVREWKKQYKSKDLKDPDD